MAHTFCQPTVRAHEFNEAAGSEVTTFGLPFTGGGPPHGEAQPPAVRKQVHGWLEGRGDKLADAGYPFGASKMVAADGSISDGAISSPPSTGSSIIKADSLDEAAKLARGCPLLQIGYEITVYEAIP